MLIKGLIILSSLVMAQGPEYTGSIEKKNSEREKRVNENLIKTNKKMEIEGKKKEMELKKEAPKDLKADPGPKKKAPFIVHPKPTSSDDPRVYRDQYDYDLGKDPSTEFDQNVQDNRDAQPESMTNEEYVRQFKENAERAGVKVHVDEKGVARPVKGGSGNH